MKNLFKKIVLVGVISYLPLSLWALSNCEKDEKNYFQFVIPNYQTTRQSGQTVNIYVKYAYKKDLPIKEYSDYRLVRAKILEYMEPSDALPAQLFWEIIATHMGRKLMSEFPLDGVSVQLTVLDNQNPNSYEPGDHGPIFTVGKIEPLDVH